MSAPALVDAGASLPALVARASQALAEATSAAEVLDARAAASLAYDAAKAAARFAKAKGAHDELIAAAHRAQADALEIEAQAKRRLADEYDAAQERGEVASGSVRTDIVPLRNDVRPATASDLGLSRKQVHDARQVRNAEALDPGVVRRTLDARLAAGQEPTKAAVNEAVSNVVNLKDRLPPLPTYAELELLNEAEEAAHDVAEGLAVDLDTAEGRARAIAGTLSTLDFIDITGREFWAVFAKDPSRSLYRRWASKAHRTLTDIIKEIEQD